MSRSLQWAVASFFILCIAMSIAELGSAAPTSGGVSHTNLHSLGPTKQIMCDIALLLDIFFFITSLPKPSLLDRRLYV